MSDQAQEIILSWCRSGKRGIGFPVMRQMPDTEWLGAQRTFKLISERLCKGEEEWGRWSDDVAKLQARAERRLDTLERQCADELVGFRRIKIQRVSLHLVCLAATAETALL